MLEQEREGYARVGQIALQRVKRRQPLVPWARQHRRILTGARTGGWSEDNAYLLDEPMAAIDRWDVLGVVVQLPSQIGKTEVGVTALAHRVAYGDDCLLYLAEQTLRDSLVRDRLRPALMSLGPGVVIDDGESRGRRHGLKAVDSTWNIRLAGAGSVTATTPATRSATLGRAASLVVLDEYDACASPSLFGSALTRASSYGSDGQVVVTSTPTRLGEGIDALWAAGSRGTYHHRCRYCHELVWMDWMSRRTVRIEEEGGLWISATLHCPACETKWSELDRRLAAKAGCYVHEDPEASSQTFRAHGLAHPWRSFQSIFDFGALAWRQQQEEHDDSMYREFVMEWIGIPWTDGFSGHSQRALCSSAVAFGPRGVDDEGEIDGRTQIVTAGVDCGEGRLFVEFVGWSYDVASERMFQTALRYMEISVGDELADPALWEKLRETLAILAWRLPDGNKLACEMVFIDSGYRPDVVRYNCSVMFDQYERHAGALHWRQAAAFPIVGRNTAEDGLPLVAVPAKPKLAQDGLLPPTLTVRVDAIKNDLDARLRADRRLRSDEERAVRWPEDAVARGYDNAYFKAFAAERRIYAVNPRTKRREWRWVQERAKNESWDCRVYATAAAMYLALPNTLEDTLRIGALEREGVASIQ